MGADSGRAGRTMNAAEHHAVVGKGQLHRDTLLDRLEVHPGHPHSTIRRNFGSDRSARKRQFSMSSFN